MAAFCTKCGSPMPSETGFCPACGTAAGAGSVTPQQGFAPVAVPVVPVAQPVPVAAPAYQATPGYSQAPPAAAGYPPAAAYPTAQPTKSGGALKIILIVIAVVIGLGLIAGSVVAYGVWKVAHSVAGSVHTDGKGNSTVSVLGNSITTGKDINITSSDLGVAIYPGATRAEGGMHMTLPTGSMVSAIYVTDDPVSSVVAFYKGKLGENESDIDTDTGSVLSSGKQGANGKSGTVITVAPASGDNKGKTQVSIVHTVSTQ